MTEQPDLPPELLERVAKIIAPHLEGGREFDQMPPDRIALRKWCREGMCSTNDATQDDALEVARAVAPGLIAHGRELEKARIAKLEDAVRKHRDTCIRTLHDSLQQAKVSIDGEAFVERNEHRSKP